jgi:hypothetical protein
MNEEERKDLSCLHCRFYTDFDNGHMQGTCELSYDFIDDTYGYNSACSDIELEVVHE